MDLLAAFFFSGFIITCLHDRFPNASDDRALIKVFSKAALVGAGILALVYIALVSLESTTPRWWERLLKRCYV